MTPVEKALADLSREVGSLTTSLENKTEWLRSIAKTGADIQEATHRLDERVRFLEDHRVDNRGRWWGLAMLGLSALVGFLSGVLSRLWS